MPGMKRLMPWIYLLATVAACGESPPPRIQSDAIVLIGARLIDGTGAEPIDDAVLVVEGGRVQAVGSRAAVAVPKGAEIVDLAGKTLIPGLVDTHAHYHGDLARLEEQYRKQLYFGVTTARSIGSDTPEKTARALDARAGGIPGPRMYTAGLGFSAPDGFPPGLPVDINRPQTEEEARTLVGGLDDLGVHFVKMWVNDMPEPGFKITPAIRAAVVGEALARGLVPVAHIVQEVDFRQLVALGVRDFLHTVDDTETGPELLQLMLDSGVTFSPTLTNIHMGWYWAEHPELLDDPETRAAFEPEAFERWSDPAYRDGVLTSEGFADRQARLRRSMVFVKTVVDAGVPVAIGTDSGSSSWNVPMGWGTHHELQLYVEAGLTPMQAIVAATRTGAELLTRHDDEADYGTLQPGQVADLIVLNADPLADVRNTLKIDRVMQAGEWVDRVALMSRP